MGDLDFYSINLRMCFPFLRFDCIVSVAPDMFLWGVQTPWLQVPK